MYAVGTSINVSFCQRFCETRLLGVSRRFCHFPVTYWGYLGATLGNRGGRFLNDITHYYRGILVIIFCC